MSTTATTARTTTSAARRGAPPGRLLEHSLELTVRAVRSLMRQPAFAIMTVVQPAIWLLLFGQLFKSITNIPGFSTGSGSYLVFLTPGIVMMTALFSSGWAGTVYIDDMNRGVMDRLLASPVSRGAMMVGNLAYQALTTTVQTLMVFGIALLAGARFPGGVPGVLVTLLASILISMIVAALSNAIALLVRQQEALIGISQFIVLPLQFVSSALMDTRLAPSWLQTVARYNPVDWAVVAARQALQPGTDWAMVWGRLGLLVAAAAVMAVLATRAFTIYQRSL
jgi:ABC-2 type transport system permease protein